MIPIAEFCDRHQACADGREWAVANCRDMAHAWKTLRPDWLLWVATRPGVLDDRTLRRFAVWCASERECATECPRGIEVLYVEELKSEWYAIGDEWSDARLAAWSAAWSAVLTARRDASRRAALAFTRPSRQRAELIAARNAASDAAAVAERTAQAAWLRTNATPNFGGES